MKLLEILVQELPKRGGWPGNIPAVVQDSSGYVYQAGGGPHLFNSKLADDWMLAEIKREQYEDALAASKTEWDGDGLPSVGCVCEVKGCIGHYLQWHKVTVFAVRGKTVFFDADDGRWGQTDSHEFRPFSPEVERKRAEGVIALSRVDKLAAPFEYGERFPDGELICPFFYELYDAIAAGKVPGIRID